MRRVSRMLVPVGVFAVVITGVTASSAMARPTTDGLATGTEATDGSTDQSSEASAPRQDDNPWPGRTGLNIAHQGGGLEGPGNTMAAFHMALENGADVLEFDVQSNADGELVVIHDDTVDRTTDGEGQVDELGSGALAELDAAYWFVPGCGACEDRDESEYVYRGYATGDRPIPPELELQPEDFRIPTLDRVLQEFPDTYLNIELKNTGDERALAELLEAYDRSDDTIVTSFHESAMDEFADHNPGVSTAPGPVTVGAFAAASLGPLPGMPLPGYQALQVPTDIEGIGVVDDDLVNDAHNHDLAVHVWTVNDRAEMERVTGFGADGIMTDRPSVLDEVLADH